MADQRTVTFTVGEDDDGIRLDRWFKRNMPDVSFNLVSRWARTGQLRHRRQARDAGRPARDRADDPRAAGRGGARRRTGSGRSASVEPLTEDEAAFVQEMVIHRRATAFVLNKPPGLATQGGTKTVQHLDRLLDGLADDDGQRPKLVHRLDKDTSGVLLVARSARAAGPFLQGLFRPHRAQGLLGAGRRRALGRRRGDRSPLAKQPGTAARRCMSTRRAAFRPRPATG